MCDNEVLLTAEEEENEEEEPVCCTVATDLAPAAIGPYSQAVRLGDVIFCSGQIPLCPETGKVVGTTTAEQTQQVIANLTAVLEAAGSGLANVIKTTCFLTDMNDFQEFNKVYAEHFADFHPARSAVQVSALPKGVRVEIEAIAYLS